MEIRAKFELIVEKHELVYATIHQMYSPERKRERERGREREGERNVVERPRTLMVTTGKCR